MGEEVREVWEMKVQGCEPEIYRCIGKGAKARTLEE
jgi:hypothetical protein